MKLSTANPRARKPRRGSGSASRPETRCEPATFAWIEPLADVDPVVVEREIVIENHVDRPVYVERPVEVEKIVEVEKLVEKPVYVDRTVEIEKIVEIEKPVYRDRTIEIEKIVEIEKPVEIEKIVERIVEKPIIVEKEVILKASAAVDSGSEADPIVLIDPKARSESKAPKAIIIGRGPSLANKVARVMPKPLPVLAGATSLLAVIVGLALMSPSGDNATAERSKANAALPASDQAPAANLTLADGDSKPQSKSRDPFAARGYAAPKAGTSAKDETAAKADAATRAAAPAAVATPLFTANLTAYSSYTPWKKLRKRAGGWIDFADQPTVKLLSVGKSSVLLFVVTDVEVIKEKSAHISYNKPVRQVKVAKGGVVRFADYRDIQGDDVTYTIRYDGSEKIKVKSAAK